jgi:proteasome accessory factor C
MPGGAKNAEAVLQRLLLVLPLAAREEGARIEELADTLGLSSRTLLRDLEILESRSYYLPAGLGDQSQLILSREHLKVWTTGEFQRPARLSPREALAVELALRIMARDGQEAGRYPRREEEVHARLVAALRSPALEERENPEASLGGAEARPDPVRNTVEDGLRLGRALTIRYRPPGRETGIRQVGPILLVHAEGRWYLVARDLEQEALRAFRLDRMLDAEVLGEGFTPSA